MKKPHLRMLTVDERETFFPRGDVSWCCELPNGVLGFGERPVDAYWQVADGRMTATEVLYRQSPPRPLTRPRARFDCAE